MCIEVWFLHNFAATLLLFKIFCQTGTEQIQLKVSKKGIILLCAEECIFSVISIISKGMLDTTSH